MMKKFLSIILAFAMMLSFSIPAFATEVNNETSNANIGNSVYLDAESKIAFANEKDALYANSPSTCSFASDAEKIDYIDELRAKAEFANGSELNAILNELESLGVYRYDATAEGISTYATENGDVTINTPTIYYNAWESSWTVTCSGEWKNDDWRNDKSSAGNVGGLDGFGVGYYNTSGTYDSIVLRASAYMSNGLTDSSYQSSGTSSRSDGDGKSGFGFQIRDKVVMVNGTSTFIGKEWYGDCTYDYDFTYYNGVATAYYVHTWNTASLTGVGFGVGVDQVSFDFSIQNEAYSFKGYSVDKSF